MATEKIFEKKNKIVGIERPTGHISFGTLKSLLKNIWLGKIYRFLNYEHDKFVEGKIKGKFKFCLLKGILDSNMFLNLIRIVVLIGG